jgi:hypothetical protein
MIANGKISFQMWERKVASMLVWDEISGGYRTSVACWVFGSRESEEGRRRRLRRNEEHAVHKRKLKEQPLSTKWLTVNDKNNKLYQNVGIKKYGKLSAWRQMQIGEYN